MNIHKYSKIQPWERQEARQNKKSFRFTKKLSHHRERRQLDAEIRHSLIEGEPEDVLAAMREATDEANEIRRKSGFGAKCVTIVNGEVIVL